MFRSRHRLHRLQPRVAGNGWTSCGWMGHDWSGRAWRARRAQRRAFRSERRRTPGAVRILVAGIAALAFARLFSAAQWTNRSRVERVMLGVGLTVLAALLLSLRRSAARDRW